jgi:NitT/TauT family transport system ATP-binding protein
MSSHPGRIAEEIPINLPDHRELDLKLDPQFIQIKRHVVQSLGH